MERAILSRHNINLLGLMVRPKPDCPQMIELLDEYIPFVTGSEINDDPLQPISRFAKDILKTKGDDTQFRGYTEERFLKN
jgi:magnesium chelatase subunit I